MKANDLRAFEQGRRHFVGGPRQEGFTWVPSTYFLLFLGLTITNNYFSNQINRPIFFLQLIT